MRRIGLPQLKSLHTTRQTGAAQPQSMVDILALDLDSLMAPIFGQMEPTIHKSSVSTSVGGRQAALSAFLDKVIDYVQRLQRSVVSKLALSNGVPALTKSFQRAEYDFRHEIIDVIRDRAISISHTFTKIARIVINYTTKTVHNANVDLPAFVEHSTSPVIKRSIGKYIHAADVVAHANKYFAETSREAIDAKWQERDVVNIRPATAPLSVKMPSAD